jgi:hypothetical protein
MVCQLLGEALVERSMFHVDDHAAKPSTGNLLGEAIRFLLRRDRPDGNIPRAIGQNNEQRFHVWVGDLLLREHFVRQEQSSRERCLAAHRDIRQRALGKHDRVRWRQDERGAVLLEYDQPDPVAALVRVCQQRQDRTFRRGHAFRHGHGPRRVHQEEHEVGGALHADFALEITFLDGERNLLALFGAPFLEWGCGADGGIEGDVVCLAVGRTGLDVPSVFALGMRAGPAA